VPPTSPAAMSRLSRLPFVLSLCCAWVCWATDRPIVGVLSVPTDKGCISAIGGRHLSEVGGSSCFTSLYTKYIESAGGRVVPIFYDASDAELTRVFNAVNGVLFTGGEVTVGDPDSSAESRQYLHAASLLFNLTLAANDAGVHIPLWGTCMGFQTLTIIAAGSPSVLERGVFQSEGISLPLELTPEAASSRLLGSDSLPPRILRWLTTENLTSNIHHDGVSPATFASNVRLASFFSLLSTNRDLSSRPFASTIEAKRYPVFGVQWHPERPLFSWDDGEPNINHGAHAVEAMQFFANFLVGEARKNDHSFPSVQEEREALIYNYVPHGADSYQSYFPPASAPRAHDVLRSSGGGPGQGTAVGHPVAEQQINWLYAHSWEASAFVGKVLELELVLDQGPCRIDRMFLENFLGVCNSRPPPTGVPPLTYTIVVSSRDLVDRWYSFLAAKGDAAIVVTSPAHSAEFKVYAFNFYDPDREQSLGFYRFEVQAFDARPAPPSPTRGGEIRFASSRPPVGGKSLDSDVLV